MIRLLVWFKNGSGSCFGFRNLSEAYEYANYKVTYRSVSRVEVSEGGSFRVLWDRTWTPESQLAGLKRPE